MKWVDEVWSVRSGCKSILRPGDPVPNSDRADFSRDPTGPRSSSKEHVPTFGSPMRWPACLCVHLSLGFC